MLGKYEIQARLAMQARMAMIANEVEKSIL